MRFAQQRVGFILLLLALVVAPGVLHAQDNNTINVSGSGIVGLAFESVLAASDVTAEVDVNVVGTNAGILALCSGNADVALATRPLSEFEEQQCASVGVKFVELLVGYDAYAFIANSDNSFLQCLTESEVSGFAAPSATGQVLTWDQVDANYAAEALSLVVAGHTSLQYARLDSVAAGDGLRSDAQIVETDADVVAAVAGDVNAVGFVALSALEAADGVQALEYQNSTLGTCITPSTETLTDRTYPLADRLFVYANADRLAENDSLSALLSFAVSEAGGEAVKAAGFVAPTADVSARAQAALAEPTTGRVFSRDVIAFNIPGDLSGTATIGGTPHLFDYANNLSQIFTASYPNATVELKLTGVPAGAVSLCNGEIGMLATYSELSEEEAKNCAANAINPSSFTLGSEAVILVANGASDYLSCLTNEQIVSAFAAQDDETLPQTWDQVDAAFAATDILIFAPPAGDSLADLLLNAAPLRGDVEVSSDPLYRAAAVANVEGAITYFTWAEYQQVLQNKQERIQLVGVGADCVAPSLASIQDGSYPLTRELKLLVPEAFLRDTTVQSVLWYIFSDTSYSLLDSAGLVGVAFGDLGDIRDGLQTAFSEAAANAGDSELNDAFSAPVDGETEAEAPETE